MKTAVKSSKITKKGTDKFNIGRLPKELEIHDDESSHDIFPSCEVVQELIYALPNWVHCRTFLDIADLLRPLNDEVAMRVVDYIRNFSVGMGRRVTGIESLDSQLLSIYKSIYEQAKTQGKKLEVHCPF